MKWRLRRSEQRLLPLGSTRLRAQPGSISTGFPSGFPIVRYQECVHCGLCTASCPTYIETCDENDSPRGRIYLMRAVADGRLAMGPGVREHLELCLDCRACESACPSGVQYGKMIEPFKIALAELGDGSREDQLARSV